MAIAFLAGGVDAVGFLSADRYFVSFMSGNTTRLAVDLVTAPGRALIPTLLILGFVAGVAGGSAAATRAGRWRKPVLMALVAALLVLGAALHGSGQHGPALAAMVIAMGAVNNTFQRNGEAAVGLTYMTGALVKLGQGIGALLTGSPKTGWAAYLALWGSLFGGAVAGAALFLRFAGATLWLAGLWAAVLALCAWWIVARDTG
jgi:uncharacterized membrane protein YoaK (UPF0700 family)